MSKAKYPKYKTSKTLWQDQIPSHWQETELRMLFADNKNKNIGLIEKNLLSLSYGKLKRKDIDNATGLVPESFEGYQIIEAGYIILRFTDLQNDKKSLRVGYANEKGIITNAYIGLSPKADINSKYYYYLLHFLDKIKYFYNLGGGVRQSLSFKEFGREIVLVPEKREQIKIAKYLDFKTSKIETLIFKKEILLKYLLERINTSIQKGIDHNATPQSAFWPSINKTWEVEKAKRIFKEFKSTNHPNEQLLAATQKRGVLPKSMCEENFVAPTTGIEGQKLVEPNDFVISLRSFQGGIEFSNYRGIISPAYTIIRLKPEYARYEYVQFFRYLFKTKQFINQLNTAITGIRDGKNVSWTDFSELLIPIPNIDDLSICIKNIEQYEKQSEIFIKEKALINEYKDAIVAEVITGKINVSNEEIPDVIQNELEEILDELDLIEVDEPELEIE
ncbi:restriction endonuclease subunit S [Flavobacterium psychrophilum]